MDAMNAVIDWISAKSLGGRWYNGNIVLIWMVVDTIFVYHD